MTSESRTMDDPPDGEAIGQGNQKNSRDRYAVPRIRDGRRERPTSRVYSQTALPHSPGSSRLSLGMSFVTFAEKLLLIQ